LDHDIICPFSLEFEDENASVLPCRSSLDHEDMSLYALALPNLFHDSLFASSVELPLFCRDSSFSLKFARPDHANIVPSSFELPPSDAKIRFSSPRLSEPNHTRPFPSSLKLLLFDHANVFPSEPESFWLDHDIFSFSLFAYAHTALSIHE
jgi:hypothetical protein